MVVINRRGFLALSAAGLAAACTNKSDVTPPGASSTSTTSAPPASPAAASGKGLNVTMTPAEADIDLGGVNVLTWAYDGVVPGREVRLKKGETLRAQVNNRLPAETSVHWHGLAIPNPMDGVPPLTQQPIAPGQPFTYEFTVPDAGTYWFHSHVGTQLDRGLYAPLIIEDPAEAVTWDEELVLVLDDWIDGTGKNPDQVFEELKLTGMPSMGPPAPDAGVTPTTPLGDDGGDVEYPYFLVNGRVTTDPQLVDYKAGQRIRLRIINAGSDTAFRVGIPDTPMTVIATDGFPVVPTQTDSVILGMGERADAIVTVNTTVPVVAAAERKNGYAQMTIRVDGAASTGNVDEFVNRLNGFAPLDTATLAATPEVQLPQREPDQTYDLRLAGPQTPYAWSINGKLYNPPNDPLPIREGERVRVRYINESRMFHPMHLHGHTFQVMQPNGPGPRKDTVLVPPLATVDTVFDANNPGKWIDHCHNTYHLESGMAVFFSYT